MMEIISHLVSKQAPKTELGKESLRKGIDTFTFVNGLTHYWEEIQTLFREIRLVVT